ncbi:Vomeronasal type-1 receptor 4, partial [Galemys pyrenaicus]
ALARMKTRDLAVGAIFLVQTLVGILGNFYLLYHYLFFSLTESRSRSTDLILKHVTVANLLVILSKGIPQTMAALGRKDFLSALGCKLVFCAHKVGRGVSMDATCLLSVFQAVTISPQGSRWAGLKDRAPRYLGTTSILCWVLNAMLNITVLLSMTDERGSTNGTRRDYGYCYAATRDKITEPLPLILGSSHDVLCVGLMLWASGSMVCTLHRHSQRVRYLHRSSASSTSSPESRATVSILVLVCTFASLCAVSSAFQICLTILHTPSAWLVVTSALTAACFPTVSPYILMGHDPRLVMGQVSKSGRRQYSARHSQLEHVPEQKPRPEVADLTRPAGQTGVDAPRGERRLLAAGGIGPAAARTASSPWEVRAVPPAPQLRDSGSGEAIAQGSLVRPLYIILVIFPEGWCGAWVWASSFWCFPCTGTGSGALSPSPEATGTQSILILACTLVSLWTLSSVSHVCLATSMQPSARLREMSMLMAACFPAVSLCPPGHLQLLAGKEYKVPKLS